MTGSDCAVTCCGATLIPALRSSAVGVAALLGQHDGDDVTGAAGAGGAPGAVQVGLVLGGRVDVDDQLHVVDVHTACGDVGGHQHPSFARGERREVAVAGGLREVAVQVN